jgi:hypothetical protein
MEASYKKGCRRGFSCNPREAAGPPRECFHALNKFYPEVLAGVVLEDAPRSESNYFDTGTFGHGCFP